MTHPGTWIGAMLLVFTLAQLLRLTMRRLFLTPPPKPPQHIPNLDGLAAAIAAEERAIRRAEQWIPR